MFTPVVLLLLCNHQQQHGSIQQQLISPVFEKVRLGPLCLHESFLFGFYHDDSGNDDGEYFSEWNFQENEKQLDRQRRRRSKVSGTRIQCE
ncbi:hypothetical protein DERP_013293 [Dermatophagoides pteronyssinus]|uniref:Secreted protein n=1 Tax=Dermatophagoides pteronyssinus TaxID=6956 RepID=A0ABQ8J3M7_DERPT|nr:hypothetical protein DERP_013293 [Dermatophagoides pteronyssinus]